MPLKFKFHIKKTWVRLHTTLGFPRCSHCDELLNSKTVTEMPLKQATEKVRGLNRGRKCEMSPPPQWPATIRAWGWTGVVGILASCYKDMTQSRCSTCRFCQKFPTVPFNKPRPRHSLVWSMLYSVTIKTKQYRLVLGTITKSAYRGADKFLARSTSRCRRTESIVSLERGVCSCAELQVFSCYIGWKKACQATRDFGRCSLFPSWSG